MGRMTIVYGRIKLFNALYVMYLHLGSGLGLGSWRDIDGGDEGSGDDAEFRTAITTAGNPSPIAPSAR